MSIDQDSILSIKKERFDMLFKSIEEVQELLDKTTSQEDRLQTSLLLWENILNKYKDFTNQLQTLNEKLEKEIKEVSD